MDMESLFRDSRNELPPEHLWERIQASRWHRDHQLQRLSFWRGFALAAGLALVAGTSVWWVTSPSPTTAMPTLASAQQTQNPTTQDWEDLEWFLSLGETQ